MVEELTPEERKDLDKKLRKVKIPYHIFDRLDGVLEVEEREEMLGLLHGLFAYTGCFLPREVILDDGTKVPLKDLLWDLMSREDLTDEEVVAARQLADLLDRRVHENRELIEKYDISEEQAEKVYFQTCGLVRAIMELRGLGDKNKEDEYARMARERRLDDAKKLLAFFKDVKI